MSKCEETRPAPVKPWWLRCWIGLSAVGLAGLLGGDARAQETALNAQHFQPVPGAEEDFPNVFSAWTPGGTSPSFGVLAHYGYRPLSLFNEVTGETVDVIRHQATADVLLSLGLGRRFHLGVALPYTVAQLAGEDAAMLELAPAALGDLRAVARVNLLRRETGPSVGLALLGTIPVGSEGDLAGAAGANVEPRLLVDLRPGQTLLLSFNAGYHLRLVPDQLESLTVGNTVSASVGLRYAVVPGAVALVAQAQAEAPVDGGVPDLRTVPGEAHLGIRLKLGAHSVVSLGAGPGLTTGYGTPVARAFGGWSWFPGATVGDRDRDGLADDRDKCPGEREDADGFQDADGCPEADNDQDGITDIEDRCMNDPEDPDRFQDADGCPDLDNDRDTIPDARDDCPTQPENFNRTQDDDGCPEQDADGDGIVDPMDRCVNEPESINKWEDSDGCPEQDRDGDLLPDDVDRCPDKAETVNGLTDEDGCPEADRDKDGVVDALDKCPTRAETLNGHQDQDGCPDTAPPDPTRDSDKDGVPDVADKCPTRPETVNGYQDEDGCPEKDSDQDGVADPVDRCPKERESRDGVLDDDGCPEPSDQAQKVVIGPDADEDGIADVDDRCPRKGETFNNFQDGDGCPDVVPADGDNDGLPDNVDKCPKKAETPNSNFDDDGCPDDAPPSAEVLAAEDQQARLLVFFVAGSTTFDQRSGDVMARMVEHLQANPQDRLRLVGYADDAGEIAFSIELSRRRAQALQEYFVASGIDAARIEIRAAGEHYPAADTASGRGENRRVRLVVLGPDGAPRPTLPAALSAPASRGAAP